MSQEIKVENFIAQKNVEREQETKRFNAFVQIVEQSYGETLLN